MHDTVISADSPIEDLQLLAKPTFRAGFHHPMSWSQSVVDRPKRCQNHREALRDWGTKGEGVGSEVVGAALQVLAALGQKWPRLFGIVRWNHRNGVRAGKWQGAKRRGYAVLRRHFRQGWCHSRRTGRRSIRLRHAPALRPLLQDQSSRGPWRAAERRPNEGSTGRADRYLGRSREYRGIYQGEWTETRGANDERIALHRFSYSESEVRRIPESAARSAGTAG